MTSIPTARPFVRVSAGRLLVYTILVIWCIISIFPLLWMVGVSLKSVEEPIGGLAR